MTYCYEKYDLSLFRQRFENTNRLNHFGYDGLAALFEYLEQLAEDTGEPIEIDVIGLCCEYARYEDLAEFRAEYGDEYETLEDIAQATTLIGIGDTDDETDGPFIIQSF
jgi:hypothetical protein